MRTLCMTIALLTSSTAALAADIPLSCNGHDWSDPATWSGAIPGVGDTGFRSVGAACRAPFDLNVDPAARPTLGSFVIGVDYPPGQAGGAFGVRMNLDQDATFDGDLALRESTLVDHGFDLTVTGTFSNCGNRPCGLLNGEGNGMEAVRTGGVITADHVLLQRQTFFSFRGGDTVRNLEIACLDARNQCPTARVVQDPTFYDPGTGLSIEGAGRRAAFTGSSGTATLILDWDAGLAAGIDWALRAEGDVANGIRSVIAQGHIVPGTQPDAEPFDPYQHVRFDPTDGFTYVGFFEGDDSDLDGVVDRNDLALFKSVLRSGQSTTFQVRNASPGASVTIYAQRVNPGACAPGAACVTANVVGTATADARGTATMTGTVPAQYAPGTVLYFQAAEGGPGGDTTEVDAARVY